jgi:dGTPase
VATIAATICKGLVEVGWELDIEMAFAIGLGHDIGHAPFGHAGEEALNKKLGHNGTFIHEVHGYRVVEHLAREGKGLNLTYGVKDGILCHNGEKFDNELVPESELHELEKINNRKHMPSSFEGCIARISDKIAYLGRDIEDAIMVGLIKKNDIPETIKKELGSKNGEIIDTLVNDVINYSRANGVIGFSPDKRTVMNELKRFNYKYIYYHERVNRFKIQGIKIIHTLFDLYADLFTKYGHDYPRYEKAKEPLAKEFGDYLKRMHDFYQGKEDNIYTIVTDYIAGMSDIYAMNCMHRITIPEPMDGNSGEFYLLHV